MILQHGEVNQYVPDRGIVRTFIEVLNQKREVVMSMKMVNFVRCRERS